MTSDRGDVVVLPLLMLQLVEQRLRMGITGKGLGMEAKRREPGTGVKGAPPPECKARDRTAKKAGEGVRE